MQCDSIVSRLLVGSPSSVCKLFMVLSWSVMVENLYQSLEGAQVQIVPTSGFFQQCSHTVNLSSFINNHPLSLHWNSSFAVKSRDFSFVVPKHNSSSMQALHIKAHFCVKLRRSVL